MSTKEQLEAQITELRDALDTAADKPLRKVFFSKYSGFYILIYTVVIGVIGFLIGRGG